MKSPFKTSSDKFHPVCIENRNLSLGYKQKIVDYICEVSFTNTVNKVCFQGNIGAEWVFVIFSPTELLALKKEKNN